MPFVIAGQSGLRLLRHQLVNPLVDDAEPFTPRCRSRVALTHIEIDILNRIMKDSSSAREALPLSRYLEKIAQFGGYLARTNDAPHGNTVMWRGMRRLAAIQFSVNPASNRSG